jgi:hypothetical protein
MTTRTTKTTMTGRTDPPRLGAEAPAGSTLARALEAAQGRGPTPDQLRALERGVFAAIAPGAAAPPSVREPAETPTSAPLSAGAVKLVALLALVSLGAGAGVRWARRSRNAVAVVEPGTAVRASSGQAGPEAESPPAVERQGVATLEAKAARPAARRGASAKRAARTVEASAGDELELLERADRALTTDPATALSLAESHAKLFPSGSMEEEREVIAVTALERLGRDREARTRADRFMRAHAGNAYALRIQRALAQNGRTIEAPR